MTPPPHGGTRIARLPAWMRPAARAVRAALPPGLAARLPPPYVYKSDGLATTHHSPFLHDAAFDAAYWSVANRWGPVRQDLRWRTWVLTRCARQCRSLPGSYAEFGVYRGASAFMMLSTSELPRARKVHLFDTFGGIPSSHLTDRERTSGFVGRLSDTSADEVALLLQRWQDQVDLVVGDLFETLPLTDTGPLAFAHLDLNAAEPTRIALEYVHARLLTGGIVILDDYGWRGYEDQRGVIDAFFAGRTEEVIALPTGQAIVSKL